MSASIDTARNFLIPGMLFLVGMSGANAVAADDSPLCEQLPALGEVAARLVIQGAEPSSAVLTTALRDASLWIPGVRALWMQHADAESVERFLASARPAQGGQLDCGRADGSHGTLLLAAPRRASIELKSEEGGRQDGFRLVGQLAERFARPILVVQSAGLHFARFSLTRHQLSHGIALPTEDISSQERGMRLQLLAYGLNGVHPVAGLSRGMLPGVERLLEIVHGTAEASGVVNRLRATASRPALRRNPLLRQVAARQAFHACRVGRPGHRGPAGREPEERVAAVGLVARRVGETVARAASAQGAFEAMVQSPSHLMTLLERDFTDGGVGVARGPRGSVCVAVLVATWPRFVGY